MDFSMKSPALISEETWDKVNSVHNARTIKRKETTTEQKKPVSLLAYVYLFLWRKECISLLVLQTNIFVMKCRNKIDKDDLEEIFHQQLSDYIISEDSFSQYHQYKFEYYNHRKG